MRYNPLSDRYHMYMGEEGESMKLLYHAEGEGLSLTTSGSEDRHNWILILDASWDRSYHYSELSRAFVPNLTTIFFDFLHVHGPGTEAVISIDKGDKWIFFWVAA